MAPDATERAALVGSARNSSFTYKGKSVDVRTVARELGVRYVLEGSIRRAGDRIRVTAQLIDALSGNHIWAEKYDRLMEDIFAVQEELTRNIVSAVAPHIVSAEAERARRRRPHNLTAYEIAVRADAHARQAQLKSDRVLEELAIGQAKESLAIDPGSLLAMDVLAKTNLRKVLFRTTDHLDAAWHEGLAYAEKAIELDHSDNRGYVNKATAFVYSLDGSAIDDALAAARRAHELNPNDLRAVWVLGLCEIAAGNPARCREVMLQALRISPRDPLQFMINYLLAEAHLLERNYAKALEYGLLGTREAPRHMALRTTLMLAHVGLGQIQNAKVVFETLLLDAPAFVQIRLDGGNTFLRNPEHRQAATTLWRIAAGLEDPSAADALR